MKKPLLWALAVVCAGLIPLLIPGNKPEKRAADSSAALRERSSGFERYEIKNIEHPISAAGSDGSDFAPNLATVPSQPELEPVPEDTAILGPQRPDTRELELDTEKSITPNSNKPVEGKVAYLTFDDGPSLSTPRILQILNEYEVKATFFVIGKTSEESKRQLKNIVNQGHALGNHTFTHNYNQIYKSAEAFKADVDRLDRFLEETVGVKPEVLRYPGGSNNQLSWRAGGRNVMKTITREMSKLGISYFDWNVSSTDAAAPVQDKQSIIDSVISNSAGKSKIIVLMHDMDLKTTTVAALPAVIAHLKSQGYRFEVLRKNSFTYQFLKP
ncbi:polysaccharide deacetylase family protein [Paenibacillus sp. LMG 31456]|uniref:Polysaccharide deacetylase family protein n=1 Tax=Paenibacillus foliorum TaxID=2654974 RepID=A0A972GZQ0_9BACL|nr:polysaccharide deacetylase family protein [Paenibacillus foliorum]NOU93541.1 polysaccharide deacetylase family protein [Paenibacillus foliorum]